MALTIKDGAGSTTSLKTTLTGSDHMPHHIVQAVSGTVAVTASAASPVFVTGAVTVSQPINVDLVVGDGVTASINNAFFDHAMIAISHSYYDSVDGSNNYLGVKFPLQYRNYIDSNRSALYVTTTASSITVDNIGFQQAVSYITSAYNASEGVGKFNVHLTGNSSVIIDNANANAAFNAISQSFTDNSIKVKLDGTNTIKEGSTDILLVRTTGSAVNINNVGFQQAVDYITSSYNSGDGVGKFNVHLTGNSNVTIDNTGFQQAINSLTASIWNDSSDYAIKVKLTGSAIAQVTNSVGTPLYVTASNGAPLQVQIRSATNVVKQSYKANIYGFDWSVDSGTFVVATEDVNRKSLIISNPSAYELYVAVGSGSDNGFLMNSITTPPEQYSFIVYPSGTYTADQYAASLFHACFFISQSINDQKVLVTRIGY
jgi:hypothetical protein